MELHDYITIVLYVVSAVGTLILSVLGILFWFIRSWMKGVTDTNSRILMSIDRIEADISETKVDLRFQDNYIKEIEQRLVLRISAVEANNLKLQAKINDATTDINKIKMLHHHNHPNDKI